MYIGLEEGIRHLALVRVGEDFVGVVQLSELLLGVRRLVHVRVARLRLIFKGKSFNPKLSGNEGYCTNALLFLVKIMLCGKLHCLKIVN